MLVGGGVFNQAFNFPYNKGMTIKTIVPIIKFIRSSSPLVLPLASSIVGVIIKINIINTHFMPDIIVYYFFLDKPSLTVI